MEADEKVGADQELSDLFRQLPSASEVGIHPPETEVAHLQYSYDRSHHSLAIVNADSELPATNGLTIDQRKISAVIEKSTLPAANVRSKIENQQNYSCDSLTINNYIIGQAAETPNKTETSNDEATGLTSGNEMNFRQRSRRPLPRPRSSNFKENAVNASRDTGYDNQAHDGAREFSRPQNNEYYPHPQPRRRQAERPGHGFHSYNSQNYNPFINPPTGVQRPRPQPRHSVKRYTRISETMTFYNADPLRKLSRVFEGFLKSDTDVLNIAVKLSPFTKRNLESVKDLLKLEKHPNIVQILDANKIFGLVQEIYIAMELCFQNLREFVDDVKDEPLNFKVYAAYSKQMMKGLDHLHSNKILHGNLKPDNILFSQDLKTVKICDAGLWKETFLCHEFKDGSSSLPGTEGFRAPEIYFDPPKLTFASDVFSIGIVIFYLFTNGHHPFGKVPHDWGYNIRRYKNRDLSLLYHPRVPVVKKPRLFYMIDGALHRKADGRPSSKKMLENLFFEGISSAVEGTGTSELPSSYQIPSGVTTEVKKPFRKMKKTLSHGSLHTGISSEKKTSRNLLFSAKRYHSLQDLSRISDHLSEKYASPSSPKRKRSQKPAEDDPPLSGLGQQFPSFDMSHTFDERSTGPQYGDDMDAQFNSFARHDSSSNLLLHQWVADIQRQLTTIQGHLGRAPVSGCNSEHRRAPSVSSRRTRHSFTSEPRRLPRRSTNPSVFQFDHDQPPFWDLQQAFDDSLDRFSYTGSNDRWYCSRPDSAMSTDSYMFQ